MLIRTPSDLEHSGGVRPDGALLAVGSENPRRTLALSSRLVMWADSASCCSGTSCVPSSVRHRLQDASNAVRREDKNPRPTHEVTNPTRGLEVHTTQWL